MIKLNLIRERLIDYWTDPFNKDRKDILVNLIHVVTVNEGVDYAWAFANEQN